MFEMLIKLFHYFKKYKYLVMRRDPFDINGFFTDHMCFRYNTIIVYGPIEYRKQLCHATVLYFDRKSTLFVGWDCSPAHHGTDTDMHAHLRSSLVPTKAQQHTVMFVYLFSR